MVKLKELLTKILNHIIQWANGNMVEIVKHEISVTITASSYKSDSVSVTKDGYKPLGIVGFTQDSDSASNIFPYRLHLSAVNTGSATISYGLKSNSSSKQTFTLSVKILWLKLGS